MIALNFVHMNFPGGQEVIIETGTDPKLSQVFEPRFVVETKIHDERIDGRKLIALGENTPIEWGGNQISSFTGRIVVSK